MYACMLAEVTENAADDQRHAYISHLGKNEAGSENLGIKSKLSETFVGLDTQHIIPAGNETTVSHFVNLVLRCAYILVNLCYALY